MPKLRRLVVFGASSAIAREILRAAAADKSALCLVSRQAHELSLMQQDLLVRGASEVKTIIADATEIAHQDKLLEEVKNIFTDFDSVIIANGDLTPMPAAESDIELFLTSLRINFEGVTTLLLKLAPYFEERSNGCIAAIGSVAGDRGRRVNYLYASAKAGLDAFLSGYRGRMSASGVRVVTIKPGFVDTPMTAGFQKGRLFASSQDVGRSIWQSIQSANRSIYVPWFWRPIMLVIKSLPEFIFQKMRF